MTFIKAQRTWKSQKKIKNMVISLLIQLEKINKWFD